MAKVRRIWSDEQKQAAADRMRETQKLRWAKIRAQKESALINAPLEVAIPVAVLEPVHSEMNMVKEAVIAERVHPLATEEASTPPARMGSREMSLVVRTDGTMVSLYGPCICGAAKRQWHKLCLRGS